ncbi:amino acid ABC transporter permease [Gryllotalpicola ginsengisoli]|uniref:amino acid ABC transporter permease n=1 Tax=Gryllotalpicola ginsengisoli TaxID=444608 RepID=UPI0003B5A750
MQVTVSALELERRRYRAGRARRSVWVGIASTLVFAALVVVGLSLTPGWPVVRSTFFDLGEAREAFPRVLQGIWLNIRVLLTSAVVILLFSVIVSALRTLRGAVFLPVRLLMTGYTDLFRGMPLIIVLYLVGFGIPALGFFPRLPAEFWGTLALVVTYTAYVSEVFRAGLEAVHPSQRLAARALGLSYGQTLRLVLLPQALRKVTPALMNDFVSLQKDVGLISVLGAVDAVRSAQIETSLSFNFTPYLLAGLMFVVLAIPMIRLTDWYSARLQRREQMGSIV